MAPIISDSVTAVNSVLRLSSGAQMRPTARMKTCTEIRLDNLRILIKEAGSQDALANAYGCTVPFIKQMSMGYKDSKSGTPKGIGDSAARMLETVMHKERGWMDHEAQQVAETPGLVLYTPNPPQSVQRVNEPPPDERDLLCGYRVASDDIRKIMLQAARDALAKQDFSKRSETQ